VETAIGEGSRKPTGLARSILDFVFRYSLVWAAVSFLVAVIVSFLPVRFFLSPHTLWDPNCQKMAVHGQLILTVLLAILAMVRLRFGEKDVHRPMWSLAVKATIASAIVILSILWAVAGSLEFGSPEAKYELSAIAAMRSIHGAKLLNQNALAPSVANSFPGRTPEPDGSFHIAGYRFTVEKLPGFGGECVVARPLVYGRSGLNTFVLAPDGVVYQRDLGDENVPDASTWDPKGPEQPWIVCE
jgi:hypothetical protein